MPRAEKDLRRLSRQDQARIRTAYYTLAAGLSHRDIKKLRGTKDQEWRLRVGDFRIRFGLDPSTRTVVVLRVLPRGRAYRD